MTQVQIMQDQILFFLPTPLMKQVMEQGGLIYTLFQTFGKDVRKQLAAGRPQPSDLPFLIMHEENAEVHVLSCRISSWPYFQEVEALNPTEREVRERMLSYALLGVGAGKKS